MAYLFYTHYINTTAKKAVKPNLCIKLSWEA